MSIFCDILLGILVMIPFLFAFVYGISLIFGEQIKNLVIRYHVSKRRRNAFAVAKSHSYYKAFLDTIRTKNLYPYMLPKMSYKS